MRERGRPTQRTDGRKSLYPEEGVLPGREDKGAGGDELESPKDETDLRRKSDPLGQTSSGSSLFPSHSC